MSGAWAIVQARMGSSRLPGKVLRPLAGRPVLWHLVHRLRACRSLEGFLIATSTDPGDDPIEAFCKAEGVPVFRGSEQNVLERYHGAARMVSAEIIVRVTGDCPLIDPETLDRMVEVLRAHPDADHGTGWAPVPMIHEGFSAITMRCLQKLMDEVPNHPAAREHVTGYLVVDPDFVRTVTVPIEEEFWFEARLSVDTPADLRFMETLYARLGVPAGEAKVADVVRLLRRHPELLSINSHVARKFLEVHDDRVLIRCDSDAALGLEPVLRCAALGEALRDGHACGVVFAVRSGTDGAALAESRGFRVETGYDIDDQEEGAWIERLVARHRAAAVVLDVRTPLSRATVERLRMLTRIVVIDDITDRRLAADIVVMLQGSPAVALDWTGFDGQRLMGAEYSLLPPSVQEQEGAAASSKRLADGNGAQRVAALLVAAIRRSDP